MRTASPFPSASLSWDLNLIPSPQVRNTATGRTWWYESLALERYPSPGDPVTSRNARPQFRVVRGPDWEGGERGMEGLILSVLCTKGRSG